MTGAERGVYTEPTWSRTHPLIVGGHMPPAVMFCDLAVVSMYNPVQYNFATTPCYCQLLYHKSAWLKSRTHPTQG